VRLTCRVCATANAREQDKLPNAPDTTLSMRDWSCLAVIDAYRAPPAKADVTAAASSAESTRERFCCEDVSSSEPPTEPSS
jgi:hypothetical protein